MLRKNVFLDRLSSPLWDGCAIELLLPGLGNSFVCTASLLLFTLWGFSLGRPDVVKWDPFRQTLLERNTVSVSLSYVKEFDTEGSFVLASAERKSPALWCGPCRTPLCVFLLGWDCHGCCLCWGSSEGKGVFFLWHSQHLHCLFLGGTELQRQNAWYLLSWQIAKAQLCMLQKLVCLPSL